MCWGMIGWGWKGPIFMWDAECKAERKDAMEEITVINAEREKEEGILNDGWNWERGVERTSGTRTHCRTGQIIPQTYLGKKNKIKRIRRGDGKVANSSGYVKHVARPLLWAECHRRMTANPNFILMDDNAATHHSEYTKPL